ncbi:MAG: HEAT repeat domain-containing protein [Myxococcales bacterium]|nr:HEAT repeat domain-containing protein [Myxococcales bacterium]
MLLAVVLPLAVIGCRKAVLPEASLEELDHEVRMYLYGGRDEGQYLRCHEDRHCLSRVCSFDHCTGALIVHRRGVQRQIANRLFLRMGDQRFRRVALARFAAILADSANDLMIRIRVVELLKRVDKNEATPLLEPLTKSTSPALQQAAWLALAHHGDRRALTPIKSLFPTKNLQLKLELIKALGAIGDESAIPLLKPLIGDDSVFVQQRAVQALGELKTRKVIPVLIGVLENDSDDFLKFAAAKALRRITGQRLGIRVKPWTEWWKRQKS